MSPISSLIASCRSGIGYEAGNTPRPALSVDATPGGKGTQGGFRVGFAPIRNVGGNYTPIHRSLERLLPPKSGCTAPPEVAGFTHWSGP